MNFLLENLYVLEHKSFQDFIIMKQRLGMLPDLSQQTGRKNLKKPYVIIMDCPFFVFNFSIVP